MGKYLPDVVFSFLFGVSVALFLQGSFEHFQRVGALIVGYAILYFHYSPYAQKDDAWNSFGRIPKTWEPVILFWGTIQAAYGDVLVKKFCALGILSC
ncbi:hypothetical protein [Aliiruegeria sabulilitoris]|uniref:hypothetical protein n=1 Tax=Aliiruegeria sabulilitoris TaxID=1510458 RepID=UPI00082E55D8|nr:hypothetical protein [Aliiruegeria sabulilitoris]NDR55292.1 hypothetical protein [Pseudoruegeria sp. M32A2M]